jgi:hypothetical protein
MDKKLEELLKKIKDEKFDFKNIDKIQLTYQLIEEIGNKDGELRDFLIYPTLAHLLHDNLLDNDELDKITNLLISAKYLTYDMSNKENFSVLRRSFSILQLAILVYKYNKDKVIKDETIDLLIEKFVDYFEKEEDLRGHVEEVGWCHSIAHSADLFKHVMGCERANKEMLEKMFNLILRKFQIKHYQYISDEDERMITAIEIAIKRDILDKDFITSWISKFNDFEKGKIYPEAYNITFNVKRFLRSLYFKFLDNKEYSYISKTCLETLNELNKKR